MLLFIFCKGIESRQSTELTTVVSFVNETENKEELETISKNRECKEANDDKEKGN
jgi:hypothetical protein